MDGGTRDPFEEPHRPVRLAPPTVAMDTARMQDPLIVRWNAVWRSVGVVPPEAGAELLAAYSESHRHYHTLQHLDECLRLLDERVAPHHGAAICRPVELGLWFHDAVYEIPGPDNEQRSADWAARVMANAGLLIADVDRVKEAIMATRHDAPTPSVVAELVVDVDLAILGAPPARFGEYEEQVRREYAVYPDDAYRQGRAVILRQFLDRPRIYQTSAFADLEAPARANLRRSLRRLEPMGPTSSFTQL